LNLNTTSSTDYQRTGSLQFRYISTQEEAFDFRTEDSAVRLDTKIDDAGIESLEYNARWGHYRLRLTEQEVKNDANVLKELIKAAYERRSSL
jgi:hypothetical protein